MSEKKAKEQRRQERLNGPDLSAAIAFQRDRGGSVSVNGNIGNPILLLEVVGMGLLSLARFYADMAKKNEPRIITAPAGSVPGIKGKGH